MTSDVRSKLGEDILVAAPWDALKPHIANIIIVDGISIIDAGEALACDEVDQVSAWLAEEALSRPTRAQLDQWDEDEPELVALIVQPWILVQR